MPYTSRSTVIGVSLYTVSLFVLLFIQGYIPLSAPSISSGDHPAVSPLITTIVSSAVEINSAASPMASPSTMRAIVMHAIGAPSVLKLSSVPKPVAKVGQVLIRIKSFGLNRSEMYTRQGHSPGVTFPRILGIEAAGIIESAPDSPHFKKGDVVVTAMGDMGRMYDGGYAEYTVVPARQVLKVNLTGDIDWKILGAVPELFQTAWGSLERSLQLKKNDKLLVRGATSGIGLAAVALAKDKGAVVVGTTRNASREALLKGVGADDVIVDKNGKISEEVKSRYPSGFDKILELVGVTTLDDSLKCAAESGTVCITGITGGKWTYESFMPFVSIPTAVKLTTYASSADALLKTPVDEIYQKILSGVMKLPIKTFRMEEIVAAHELIEFTGAEAKVVVLVD